MEILNEAVLKIESGKTEEGLNILNQLKRNSIDKTLLSNIAHIYANYGFLHEAIETAQTLLKKYPNEEEFIFLCAECFIELGNDQEALELLHSIEQSSPYYIPGLLLLADLYQTQGLEEVAENKLLEASKLNPTEPIIWYALAEFYLTQGKYYKANLYFEKLIQDKQFSEDEAVNLHYAETLSMLGQFEQSLPYFQKGLQSNSDLDGLFRYGFTAYKAEQFDKAIQILSKLQSLDPQYSTLYPILANAYVKIGNLNKAIDTLKKGLTYDERNDELYYLISQLFIRVRKKSEAEQYLKKALSITNPSLETIKMYLSLLKENQRHEEIIEVILDIREQHDVHDPFFDWELANAYEQIEDYRHAHEYYQLSYPYLQDNSEFLEQYGFFLLEEGKIEEAKKCFTKAIAIDKNLFHLEELMHELENKL